MVEEKSSNEPAKSPGPISRRRPWVAGMMSLQLGFGQLYNGQPTKALLFYLAAGWGWPCVLVLIFLYSPLNPLFNMAVAVILSLIIFIAIILDAVIVAKREGREYRKNACNRWYVYLGVLAVVALVTEGETDLVRSYVQAFNIPSGAMMPTLLIGDHIYVDKSIQHGWKLPERGEVVVFKFPEDETKDFIKRVIGMPGDIVEIQNKNVLINGIPLDDKSYTQRIDPNIIDRLINSRDNFGPVTVPATHYFVLGDNRDQSLDSRFWGFVELSKIKGKAVALYWSWDGADSRVRWERIGRKTQRSSDEETLHQ
jgi:signal peptidase I